MSKEILSEDILRLCRTMSVSGFEYRASDEIRNIYGHLFDEISSDCVGNHILVKKCGLKNAPKIFIDAHLDEVGMLVSDVLEGGFLRIVNIGGIDPAIMQAADVVVYGKEEMRGVVISIPPHLRSADDQKLPPVNELLVDVGEGYTKQELVEKIPIGSPVGYAPVYSKLENGYMAGKSFDDKACAAIAARAIADTPRDRLAGDVYLCFSAREETARDGGVGAACFKVEPDYAMVIDVNLGNAPDVPERETVEIGKGISISYSAATHRGLTEAFSELCSKKSLDSTRCAAPSSTGTNATTVNLSGLGIPVVDVGLPLRNMHTYNEVISLDDCNTLSEAVREFICSKEISKRFAREDLLCSLK